MLQTIFASLWALATLILYQLWSDRWEGDSLQRRQLDAWAALSALVALGLILDGGASVSRAAMRSPGSGDPALAPVATTRTVPSHPDASGSNAAATNEAAAVALLPPAPVVGVVAGDAATVAGAAQSAAAAPAGSAEDPSAVDASGASSDPRQVDSSPVTVPGEQPAAPPAAGAAPAAPPAADDPVTFIGVAPTRAASAATAAPISPVVAPPVVRPISPTQAPEPTVEAPPPAPLVPTPVCGDPRDLKANLSIFEAQVERSGEHQIVRFRADLQNNSGFPVVATGMVAVAQDGRSSADQFGSERLPDVQIDALRSIVVEGRIALERLPSPMSRSELCISFVAETCGLRSDTPLTRRCFKIGGF